MTDCEACLRGDHNSCVGVGCACFERTCAAAEEQAFEDEGLRIDYEVMRCVWCHAPYDDWHRSRVGKTVYLSCRLDRKIGSWLSRVTPW